MPRERTGTVWRAPDNSQLKIRLTVVDAQGKKHRPWLEIDPKFKDDAARRIAAKTSTEISGQPWDPSRFQRLKTTGTIVSCDDYFEKLWIPSRIGKLRSVRSDRYRWRKHVSPLIGSRLVNEITSDDLRDVAQALDAKAVKKGGRAALF